MVGFDPRRIKARRGWSGVVEFELGWAGMIGLAVSRVGVVRGGWVLSGTSLVRSGLSEEFRTCWVRSKERRVGQG